MSSKQRLWLFAVMFLVLVSGVAVANMKYQSRLLFVESQKLRASMDKEVLEEGRLRLGIASRGDFDHVVREAAARLDMQSPSSKQVVVLD